MDTKEQKEILNNFKEVKEKTPLRLYFNCPPRLYSRILAYSKNKGLKDSTLFLVSIDEYLTKQNF